MTEKYIPGADGLEARDRRSANTRQFAEIISTNVTPTEAAHHAKQATHYQVVGAIWQAEAPCYDDEFIGSDAAVFRERFWELLDNYLGNAEDEAAQFSGFVEWCSEALEGRDLRNYFIDSMAEVQTGENDRDDVKVNLLTTLDSTLFHQSSPQWYDVVERLLPGGPVNEEHRGFEDAGQWDGNELFESGKKLPGIRLFMTLLRHMNPLDQPSYEEAGALLAEQFYLAYTLGAGELTSEETLQARINEICDMAAIDEEKRAIVVGATEWSAGSEHEEQWVDSDVSEESLVGLSRIYQERFEQDHPFVSPEIIPVEDCLTALRNFPSLVEHIEVGESERWGHRFDNQGRYQEAGGSDTYLLHADSNQTYIDPDTQQILTIRHFAEQRDRMIVSYEYQKTPEEVLGYDNDEGPAVRWSELEMTNGGVRIKTCIMTKANKKLCMKRLSMIRKIVSICFNIFNLHPLGLSVNGNIRQTKRYSIFWEV